MGEDPRTSMKTWIPPYLRLAESEFQRFRQTEQITSMHENDFEEIRVRRESEIANASKESETDDIFTIYNPEDSNINDKDTTVSTDNDKTKIIIKKQKSSNTNWLCIYIFLAICFVLCGLGFAIYAYMHPKEINHHSHYTNGN